MAVSLNPVQHFTQWFHDPVARAAVLYILGILGVLAFSYFVTRQWL